MFPSIILEVVLFLFKKQKNKKVLIARMITLVVIILAALVSMIVCLCEGAIPALTLIGPITIFSLRLLFDVIDLRQINRNPTTDEPKPDKPTTYEIKNLMN